MDGDAPMVIADLFSQLQAGSPDIPVPYMLAHLHRHRGSFLLERDALEAFILQGQRGGTNIHPSVLIGTLQASSQYVKLTSPEAFADARLRRLLFSAARCLAATVPPSRGVQATADSHKNFFFNAAMSLARSEQALLECIARCPAASLKNTSVTVVVEFASDDDAAMLRSATEHEKGCLLATILCDSVAWSLEPLLAAGASVRLLLLDRTGRNLVTTTQLQKETRIQVDCVALSAPDSSKAISPLEAALFPTAITELGAGPTESQREMTTAAGRRTRSKSLTMVSAPSKIELKPPADADRELFFFCRPQASLCSAHLGTIVARLLPDAAGESPQLVFPSIDTSVVTVQGYTEPQGHKLFRHLRAATVAEAGALRPLLVPFEPISFGVKGAALRGALGQKSTALGRMLQDGFQTASGDGFYSQRVAVLSHVAGYNVASAPIASFTPVAVPATAEHYCSMLQQLSHCLHDAPDATAPPTDASASIGLTTPEILQQITVGQWQFLASDRSGLHLLAMEPTELPPAPPMRSIFNIISDRRSKERVESNVSSLQQALMDDVSSNALWSAARTEKEKRLAPPPVAVTPSADKRSTKRAPV